MKYCHRMRRDSNRYGEKYSTVFRCWGYELVIPPVVEFLEALLSNEDDLDLQTLKVVDQVSGRMMGVRPDITPQVARIDAHRLQVETPQRLCYLGPVVHAKPDKFAGSRNPLQIGAELYGHGGIESDAEIVCLMAEILSIAELSPLTLELGHMGVFKALVESAELSKDQESHLLDVLLRKAEDELANCLDSFGVEKHDKNKIRCLESIRRRDGNIARYHQGVCGRSGSGENGGTRFLQTGGNVATAHSECKSACRFG